MSADIRGVDSKSSSLNTQSYSRWHLVGMLRCGEGRNSMPDDQPTASANRELAARIVAAYVRRNQVGSDQIPALISTVHQALAGLGKCESKEAGPRIPAVSLRESVRPDTLCAWIADAALKCCGAIS